MSNLYVGIAGVATSGKDTYYSLLNEVCSELLYRKVIRFALADNLKKDLADFLFEKYDVDIYNCSASDKSKIRHELVKYAKGMRIASNGRYWIARLTADISSYKKQSSYSESDIFCITDIRHFEYQRDEIPWIKKENNGILIYVEKIFPDGSVCKPANDDESRNDPLLRKHADFTISWRHGDSREILKNIVKKQVECFVQQGILSYHGTP